MTPAANSVLTELGQAEFLSLGSDEKFQLDPELRAMVANWRLDRGALIDNVTAVNLAEVIRNDLSANKTTVDILADMQGFFNDPARQDKIAANETGLFATYAQLAAFKQLGIKGKSWLSMHDPKVRDTHVGLDGQTLPLGENFVSSSGATGPGPRQMGEPAEDINCRCFLLPINLKNQREAIWKVLDTQLRTQERVVRGVVSRIMQRQSAIVRAAYNKARV